MSPYEPDPKTAKLFAGYKQATEIIKRDKKHVLAAAEQAIRQGATSPELAALTGMAGQTFRTLAEKIGVDIRVKPPTVGPEAAARRTQLAGLNVPVPNERPSPIGTFTDSVDLATLTDQQAAELAAKAFATADPRQFAALNAASSEGDRAVITAALDCGTLNETDLRTA